MTLITCRCECIPVSLSPHRARRHQRAAQHCPPLPSCISLLCVPCQLCSMKPSIIPVLSDVEFQELAAVVVKRFRRFREPQQYAQQPEATSASVSLEAKAVTSHAATASAPQESSHPQVWQAPLTKHGAPFLPPFGLLPEASCMLAEPPVRVDDKGKGKSKTRSIYPSVSMGTPAPPNDVQISRFPFTSPLPMA